MKNQLFFSISRSRLWFSLVVLRSYSILSCPRPCTEDTILYKNYI